MRKLLFFIFLFLAQLAYAEQAVVAIVNTHVITDLDVKKRMNLIIKSNNLPNTPETLKAVRWQVLQMLIDEKLFDHEAKKLKLSIDESDIKTALDTIAANNNIKPNQLGQFLQGMGISKAELENQVKHQLTWSKIIQTQIEPLITVTEQDLKNCKLISIPLVDVDEDQVKLAEITIYPNKKNTKDVQVLLEQLEHQIQTGGDFAKLASNFSQSSSAKKGGEIGWFYINQLSKEFAAAVLNLKAGQVSDPIITADSIHLVKILERKSSKTVQPQAAKGDAAKVVMNDNELSNSLRQRKLDVRVKAYLLKLRKQAFIDLK